MSFKLHLGYNSNDGWGHFHLESFKCNYNAKTNYSLLFSEHFFWGQVGWMWKMIGRKQKKMMKIIAVNIEIVSKISFLSSIVLIIVFWNCVENIIKSKKKKSCLKNICFHLPRENNFLY